MKRDLETLASRVFDLVIVGAGVYGAAAAWDAAYDSALELAFQQEGGPA